MAESGSISLSVTNANVWDRPTLKDLYNHVVPKVADKWRDLAVQLLRPDRQEFLNVIAADHPRDVVSCCKCALQKWLDTLPDASWSQLIQALNSPCIQLNHLASQIEQMVIRESESTNNSGLACNKLTSIEEIEVEFAKMTNKVKKVLNSNNVSVASLVEQLCTISVVSDKNVPLFDEDVFDRLKTIDEFWRCLRNFWSIYDYDLLRFVITLSSCNEAQEILEEFLSRIDPLTIEDVDLVLHCRVDQREGSLKPLLRIKVNAEKCSLNVKTKVKKIVSEKFNLEKYALCFKGIKTGCIELLFCVSKAVMAYILQCKITGNILAEFSAHKIISLHIDDTELRIPPRNTDVTYTWSVQQKPYTAATRLSVGPEHNGVAVIIGNSYTRQDVVPVKRTLHPLDGSHKDAEMMKESFKYLKFCVMLMHNVTQDELMALLYSLADHPYPKYCRRFVFAFSGHGGDGFICSEDEKSMAINDIIGILTPKSSNDSLIGIPRLFFFDTCRGVGFDMGIIARGGDENWRSRIPSSGDVLVAYATTGGLWTSILAEKLVTSPKSVYDILTEVDEELIEKMRTTSRSIYAPGFHKTELLGRLNEIIELLNESGQPPMVRSLAGVIYRSVFVPRKGCDIM